MSTTPVAGPARWRSERLHWHGFIHPNPAASATDREERLASGDGAVLCTPHAVAGWVARRAAKTGHEVLLFDQEAECWHQIGDAGTDRVRLEILLVAGRGASVYAASRSNLQDHYVSVEAVNSAECTRHDYFATTLVEHCRER